MNKRHNLWLAALVAALGLATLLDGCGPAETVTLTGTVELTKARVSGGLFGPTGYQLTGQKDYTPLYLRKNNSLEDPEIARFADQKVDVTGYVRYYSTAALYPSLGQPNTTYWIMDVTSIARVAPLAQPEAAKPEAVKKEGTK